MNRKLATSLLLCQNKGLLETMVHKKVARVRVPHEPLSLALYYFKDKMVINDKYGQQEGYCGFTQDFEEKDGYKLHVKS